MDDSKEDMMCRRDPYWDECDDAQKWKRMVSFVIDLSRKVEDLEDQVDALMQHQHLNDKIVVPIAHEVHATTFNPYRHKPFQFRTTEDQK